MERYSQAVIDGDVETAWTYMVPRHYDSCGGESGRDHVQVTVVEAGADSGAGARGRSGQGRLRGGFVWDVNQSQEVFLMKKIDGSWLVDIAPVRLSFCAPWAGVGVEIE